MNADAILLEGVHKFHGAHHALRGIDLRVAAGERVVVCGPSGSGKSTLIRTVNGLDGHDRGRVVVEGVELTRAPQSLARVRREVGFVFQQFNLFPHMTALENCVLAPMQVRGVGRAEAERGAMELLARVRVLDQARKYPAQLSGGQQQRVAIARALAMKPRILLLDEPTSALDPEMIGEVLDVLVELARSGMTMVCVTHEMGFARAVADRVLFMDAGELVEQGPPAAFFDAPASERLRGFLSRLTHAIPSP